MYFVMSIKSILFSTILILTQAQLDKLETAKQFQEFKIKYNKNYSSPKEEAFRESIFFSELLIVQDFNSQDHSYKIGINEYSDWTNEERERLNGVNYEETEKFLMTSTDLKLRFPLAEKQAAVPIAMDWPALRMVTPVKNQGTCGSCWAFAAIGALESRTAIKSKRSPVSLSEQQLVDCSKEQCSGGFMAQAYDYIKQAGGVNLESDYPYSPAKGERGTCKYNWQKTKQTVSGYTIVSPAKDENALRSAVGRIGPMAGVIEVSGHFQRYASGVYSFHGCTGKYNHGIVVAGYGRQNNKDYWLVKNSWGEGWGEKGYIKTLRNVKNHCGIASVALYPY